MAALASVPRCGAFVSGASETPVTGLSPLLEGLPQRFGNVMPRSGRPGPAPTAAARRPRPARRRGALQRHHPGGRAMALSRPGRPFAPGAAEADDLPAVPDPGPASAAAWIVGPDGAGAEIRQAIRPGIECDVGGVPNLTNKVRPTYVLSLRRAEERGECRIQSIHLITASLTLLVRSLSLGTRSYGRQMS